MHISFVGGGARLLDCAILHALTENGHHLFLKLHSLQVCSVIVIEAKRTVIHSIGLTSLSNDQ